MTLIIAALAVIGVAMVHVRRAETRANYQIQQLQSKQDDQRRRLYELQAGLGRQIAPQKVRERMEQMDLDLTTRVVVPPVVAHRLAADDCDQ